MLFPNALQYSSWKFLMVLVSLLHVELKRMVWLANCWCVIGFNLSTTTIPYHFLTLLSSLMLLPSASTIMMNIKGDNGSPYLIPLVEEKNPWAEPFTKIKNFGVHMQLLTQLIKISQGSPSRVAYQPYHRPWVCLTSIDHAGLPCLPSRMNSLMCHDYSFYYWSPWWKPTFLLWYDFTKDLFESICNELSDYLVYCVVEGDWFEINHFLWIFLLWDEGQKGVIHSS